MSPLQILNTVIIPSLEILGDKYNTLWAQVMLLSIALQEDGPKLDNHVQLEGGLARGLWQFQIEAVNNLFLRLPHIMAEICQRLGVESNEEAVYQRLAVDDILACICARLTLWLDPVLLPSTQSDGWEYYVRNWRPGKPRPDDWPTNWTVSKNTVEGATL